MEGTGAGAEPRDIKHCEKIVQNGRNRMDPLLVQLHVKGLASSTRDRNLMVSQRALQICAADNTDPTHYSCPGSLANPRSNKVTYYCTSFKLLLLSRLDFFDFEFSSISWRFRFFKLPSRLFFAMSSIGHISKTWKS